MGKVMIERNFKPLSKCTDDEIEAEAARRRSTRIKNKHKIRFCDECVHFRVNYDKKEIPDDDLMKACKLGHKTHFIMPEHPTDDKWGFYRMPCPDRDIAIDRKWPWQIEEEKEIKRQQEYAETLKKFKHKEWNRKLEEKRLNKLRKE